MEQGEELENVLSFLRGSGCSKLESIAVVASCSEIGLARAKEVVHLSAVWNDRRVSDDALHETTVNAISAFKSDSRVGEKG
jgi:hypothetical protein